MFCTNTTVLSITNTNANKKKSVVIRLINSWFYLSVSLKLSFLPFAILFMVTAILNLKIAKLPTSNNRYSSHQFLFSCFLQSLRLTPALIAIFRLSFYRCCSSTLTITSLPFSPVSVIYGLPLISILSVRVMRAFHLIITILSGLLLQELTFLQLQTLNLSPSLCLCTFLQLGHFQEGNIMTH